MTLMMAKERHLVMLQKRDDAIQVLEKIQRKTRRHECEEREEKKTLAFNEKRRIQSLHLLAERRKIFEEDVEEEEEEGEEILSNNLDQIQTTSGGCCVVT